MRRRLVCAAAAVALVTLAGCGGMGQDTAGEPASDTAAGGAGSMPQGFVDEKSEDGTATGGDISAPTVNSSVALTDRSIIRTGSVRIQADGVESAALAAAAAARALGGLVFDEQTVTDPSDPDRTVAQLTLRVPSDRFDALLLKVRGLGEVLEQTQQADDVTAQVADVDARVDAQRASVRRIQALLARANTIGEVVTVEAQLAQRQSDLESLEAQQKALADQTALATLQVGIVGPDPAGTVDEDETGFVAGLQRGWEAFTSATTAGLTAIGVLLPFVGFALVIILPLVAWSRSRARKQSVVPPATPYEPPVRENQPVG